jgi:hypothetical protein
MPRPGRETIRSSITQCSLVGVTLLFIACAHSLPPIPEDTASLADAGSGGATNGGAATTGRGGGAGAQLANGAAGNGAAANSAAGNGAVGTAGSGAAGSSAAGATSGSAGSGVAGSGAGGASADGGGSNSAAGSGEIAGSPAGGSAGAMSSSGGQGGRGGTNNHQCNVTIDLNGYTASKAGCGNYTTCKGQIHWQNNEAQALTMIVISFTEPRGTTCTGDHAGSKWTITDTGSISHRCTFTASGAPWGVNSMAMFGFGYDTTQSDDTPPNDVTISDPSCGG